MVSRAAKPNAISHTAPSMARIAATVRRRGTPDGQPSPKSARHATVQPARADRVALAKMAPTRSAHPAMERLVWSVNARGVGAAIAPSPSPFFVRHAPNGSTTSRGSVASQYIAPIVGNAKTPQGRGPPRTLNASSRNTFHSGAVEGARNSIPALAADSSAPATNPRCTPRAIDGERASVRVAKKANTPLQLRRANLSAAARYTGALAADAKVATHQSAAARTVGSSRSE